MGFLFDNLAVWDFSGYCGKQRRVFEAGLGVLLEDIDVEAAKRIFEVNFDGTLLGCKHAIRNMKSRGGSIINMSSIGGLVPYRSSRCTALPRQQCDT